MKIAEVSPLYESVPPRLYGGTERVVASLCDALVRQGHEVDLYASGDSHTHAHLIECRRQAIRLDPALLKSDLASHCLALNQLRQHADEYDVIHFHTDILHFPFFEDIASRTLTTLHGRVDIPELSPIYQRWHTFPLAAISHHQQQSMPQANWQCVVHNGLDDRIYRFTPQPKEGYLAFLGRISPEKRPDRAIRIAQQAGIPLKIAAKVDDADKAYWQDVIQPLLAQSDSNVEFIGEISDADKSEFLGNALALLFPIDWPEPFGLVMIEAMACGTPVIAWPNGAVPEVIEPGRNGLIVTDERQAVAACHAVGLLNRQKVRESYEHKFTSDVMAKSYVQAYEKLRYGTHGYHAFSS